MADLSAARFVYRNPLDLPRIGYADIIAGGADGVYVEQPGTPRVFPRAAPVFHDDPDNTGLFPPFHDISVTSPPVFTVSLRDVMLVGFRSILWRDDTFVNDLGHLTPEDVRGFVRGLARSNELGPLLPTPMDEAFECHLEGCPQVRLEGPVVVLTSAEPGNFGSFLYREIVKLVNLAEIPANWRFLIHDAADRCREEFLRLAGVSADRLVRHDLRTIYHIDQAIVPGLRSPFAFADPQSHAFYGRLRAKCETGARGRRIYVSRLAVGAARPNGRVMLNEEELVARLQDLGFDIVTTEHLSAAEHISVFAAADLIVGPSGSGMFNSVFCREGTKLIDIESEPHWIYPHACLFASAGLRYGVFEGVAVNRDWSIHHKPFKVNVEALLRRIEVFDANEAGDAPAKTGVRLPKAGASFWTIPDHSGEDYIAVLERAHRTFQPRTYLEIGVAGGRSLALAKCASIGIDPNFNFETPVLAGKPACCLYQMTGDRFFQDYDPKIVLGQPIEMAFLDGMHWFEVLLRDFINTERNCKPNSIIFLHNCLPTDEYVGRRDPEDHRLEGRSAHPEGWAGDVWKTLAILLKFRPDLRITVFNAPPTGLVAITRLDPGSTLLADRYFDLVDEYRDYALDAYGEAFYAGLELVDTRRYAHASSLSSLFWI